VGFNEKVIWYLHLAWSSLPKQSVQSIDYLSRSS